MADAAAVVILAAGSGSRVGAPVNKVLLPWDGVPMVVWSARDALAVPGVERVLVVVREGEQPAVAEALRQSGLADERLEVTVGGASRHESERRALRHLAAAIEAGQLALVAIHDAARPSAGVALFEAVLAAAAEHGGAVPVLDLVDVAARDGTPLPDRVVAVQTPQAFRAVPLLTAYAAAERDGFAGTDTAACVEAYAGSAIRVAAVPGHPGNRKITFAEDLRPGG